MRRIVKFRLISDFFPFFAGCILMQIKKLKKTDDRMSIRIKRKFGIEEDLCEKKYSRLEDSLFWLSNFCVKKNTIK